ncbi:MAG: hypothetical protein JNK21_05325 [Rhodospirillaceae bacterium]|nr:hypothetical protein [Rhodospirillaceae bacterium]
METYTFCGLKQLYTAYRITSLSPWDLLPVPGLYFFCKANIFGGYTPAYIGETENAQTRLPYHERWAEAVRLGANHVFGLQASGIEHVRCDAERDLIAFYQPSMNTQHRGLSAALAALTGTQTKAGLANFLSGVPGFLGSTNLLAPPTPPASPFGFGTDIKR